MQLSRCDTGDAGLMSASSESMREKGPEAVGFGGEVPAAIKVTSGVRVERGALRLQEVPPK